MEKIIRDTISAWKLILALAISIPLLAYCDLMITAGIAPVIAQIAVVLFIIFCIGILVFLYKKRASLFSKSIFSVVLASLIGVFLGIFFRDLLLDSL